MKRFILFVLLVAVAVGGWYRYNGGFMPKSGEEAGVSADQGGRGEARREGRRGGGNGGGRRGGRSAGNDGPTPVIATPARYDDVPVTADAVGTIQALNTVTVRTQVDGRLMQIMFKDGQDVKRGDILAQVDPATYQAQYDQAVAKKAQDEAQVANAKMDLDRYSKLAVTDAGSRQQADTQKSLVAQLTAQIRSDQGAIDNAKAVLDYTTIRSPLDGRTGIRQVDQGNIVHASDSNGIVVITQLQPISMIFNLPQQQLRAVNDAMARGTVEVDALESDATTVIDKGVIEVMDNQIDQTTGTVRIKARFPNDHFQLWPGQFVNVKVYVDVLKHVVVAPTASVQRGPDGAYVFIVDDQDTVHQTPVTVGQQDETTAVITKGVTPPAKLVTTGFARLVDNAKVRVQTPEEAAQAATTPAANTQGRRGARQGQGQGQGRRRREDQQGASGLSTGSQPQEQEAPKPAVPPPPQEAPKPAQGQ